MKQSTTKRENRHSLAHRERMAMMQEHAELQEQREQAMKAEWARRGVNGYRVVEDCSTSSCSQADGDGRGE
jgi:hypothetical protein